jgi:hypothetical protein
VVTVGGQDGQAFTGALVNTGLASGGLLAVRDLTDLDRARLRPWPPPGRLVRGPLCDVEVEGTHDRQAVRGTLARAADLDRAAVGVAPTRGLGSDALLPRRGHLGVQAQRVDAGMVLLQVPPEQPAQGVGQPDQGDVVDADLTLPQVVDDQVAYRAALDAAPVDEVLDG